MLLIDFWFGSQTDHIAGGAHLRDSSYDELYKLVLHSAMLATGLAGALPFSTIARRLVMEQVPQGSRSLGGAPTRQIQLSTETDVQRSWIPTL